MKKVFKKIVATVLTAAMAMGVGAPAFAMDEVQYDAPKTVMSYLTDEMGNVTPIEGVLVDSPQALSNDEYVANYEFLLPLSAVSKQLSATGTDSSVSVRANTKIYYQTQNTPTEYKLTAVEGSWTVLDGTVSVVSANLSYVCRNLLFGSGQFKSHSNISNNFYYATGFGTFVPETDVCTVGATLTMNLKHASSSYTWQLQNYAVD